MLKCTAAKWLGDTARLTIAGAVLDAEASGYPVFRSAYERTGDTATVYGSIALPNGDVYFQDVLTFQTRVSPRNAYLRYLALPYEFVDSTDMRLGKNRRAQVAQAFGVWVGLLLRPCMREYRPTILRRGIASYVIPDAWVFAVLREGDFYAIADRYEEDGDERSAGRVRAAMKAGGNAAGVLAAMMEG